MSNKNLLKRLLMFVLLTLVTLPFAGAVHAEEGETYYCSLVLQSQNVNSVTVVAGFPIEVGEWQHIGWPNDGGGTDTRSGESRTIDLSYDAGPKQIITLYINGSVCKTLEITIEQWETDGGEEPEETEEPGSVPGPVFQARPSIPVTPGSLRWQCKQIEGTREDMRWSFTLSTMGQLPEGSSFTVKINGNILTQPPRNGEWFNFYYDMSEGQLEENIRLEIIPDLLGDFEACLTVDFQGNASSLLANNYGNSVIVPGE